MNLDELKKQFQVKNQWKMMTLVLVSVIWLIVSIIMKSIDSSDLNQALLIASVTFFTMTLTFWLIWFAVVYEKKRKQQIEYIYLKYATHHNMQNNRNYRVLSLLDIRKKYLRKSPFYKYTYPVFSLYMIDQDSMHECYAVNFMQSTGKSSYVKSSGLIYAYPTLTGITPESIASQIRIEEYMNKIKFSEEGHQYLIYFEMNKQIPTYRKFIESESEKIHSFASVVFQFFDQCSDLTK